MTVTILPILVFIHILLMVFWLGTDVGVFISALRYIDPDRPLAERAAVMDMGIIIDRYPRVCFVAMLPVGLQMAWLMGLVTFPAWLLALVWTVSALWMITVITIIRRAGTPLAKLLQTFERMLLVVGGVTLLGLGIAGFAQRIAIPEWFAGKLLAYGCICFFGLLLDHSFGPVVEAFGTLAADGTTPDREAVLRKRMWRSLRWVLAIYAAVATAGFLGTVQP